MALICDVCKGEVPDGTRFCPKCGLEIVTERERASRPPPMERDVFDWDESPGKPKDYEFSKKQLPGLDAERTRELLQVARTRLEAGQVLDASALLKQVRPQLARHTMFRAIFDRLAKAIEARKQIIQQRCDALAEEGDSNRLVSLLAGQAANELEPEEICIIALSAAHTLFQARRADGAADVLRLPPFRTLREEELVQEHRQLELQVHRMRARQHALRSAAFLGSVFAIATVVLTLFAMLIWQGGMRLALWILIPIVIIAPFFVANARAIRRWWQSWAERSASRSRSQQKLQQFLRERRK